MTKYKKVLAYIKRSKAKGRRYGEIQRYIVEKLNGKDYDEMEEIVRWSLDLTRPIAPDRYESIRTVVGRKRRWRGYWADHLVGNYREVGLLYRHCHKNDKGRWVYGSPRP